MSSAPESIRPAATLVLLRDGPSGLEVLMLRRAERPDDRMSGTCVFPGGKVERADAGLHPFAEGVDDAAASRLLGLEAGGLDFMLAAVRECFEESGLLLAVDAQGDWVDPPERSRPLDAACREHGWRLAADRLAYFAHWLTPVGVPRRFDTRFFVALAPPGQVARADGVETVDHLWLRPADALRADSGLKLMQITRHILGWAAGFDTAEACIAHARGLAGIRRQMGRIGLGRAGPRTILPHEAPYAEIARLDPEGRRLDVRHEIEPGVPVHLSPHVIRVTAPNPGVMTGPGTNSYLVGGGALDEWAVIDPGPDDPAHIAALIAAAPGPIRLVLATHTHSDHSPGCVRLAQATGATVLGRIADHPERQDATFRPQREPRHGERIAIGDVDLRVIHTPGHASNHLCFLLEAEKLLFTGDQVMQGSTVVINPPDGDMAAYLRSLEALAQEDIDWLAPGHGFLIDQPQDALRRLVRHRLAREAKVRAALQRLPGRLPVEALVPRVYDDVAPRLHGVAGRSLLAHLLKLRQDGVADETAEGWGLTPIPQEPT